MFLGVILISEIRPVKSVVLVRYFPEFKQTCFDAEASEKFEDLTKRSANYFQRKGLSTSRAVRRWFIFLVSELIELSFNVLLIK